MISNIGLDFEELSHSLTEALQSDGKSKPICISERFSSTTASPFCSYFYQTYQQKLGNNNVPKFQEVVQSVNVSYPGAMESEFMNIMRRLHRDDYKPDAYITFSEPVFEIINNVRDRFY